MLSDALAELKDREVRLAKLESELTETRAAIRALRRLLGERLTPLRASSDRQAASPSAGPKPGELKQSAIELVRGSLDPLTREQIGERIGRNGRGLGHALRHAVASGELVLIGDAYGIAPAGASAEDLAIANGAAGE